MYLFKNNRTLSILLSSFLLLMVAACDTTSSEEGNGDPELYPLGEFVQDSYTVTAWSTRPLSVGFHEIYLEVMENGIPVEGVHVHFNTMMHMEGHSHSSPYGEPDEQRDEVYNLYEAWAIFTMAGEWELEITVHSEEVSETEISGSIPVEVDHTDRVKLFEGENGSHYILTWIEPKEPEVGMNDLLISLHRSVSHSEYPAVLNAQIGFEPWMPAPGMDHGSSNNVDPEHQGNGFYQGKVNFNMTGDWELRFDISQGGEKIGEPVIELNF